MSQTFERDSVHRRPMAFSILLIGAVAGVDLLLKATSGLLSLRLSVMTTGIISGAVLSALGAVLIRRLGVWGEFGLTGRPARWRTLLWFLPFAIFGMLPLTEGLDATAGKVAGAVAFGALVAFWKLAVLGLALYAWLPRGARAAAGRAALVWGAMHLGGILLGGIVAPTLVLCLSYVFLGFAFAAVRLRTGLLWPLVASYALLLTTASAVQEGDATNLVASMSDVMPALAVSVLLAVYGLVVWRRPSATDDPTQDSTDGSMEGAAAGFPVARFPVRSGRPTPLR
ncbi:MAG: hypothetical protein ACR2KK_14210 [Acidimicrobiales bacterium]